MPKRKRPTKPGSSQKRVKPTDASSSPKLTTHPILHHYFHRVQPLRDWLIAQFPAGAPRAKVLARLTNRPSSATTETVAEAERRAVIVLLDSVLVASANEARDPRRKQERARDLAAFSQECPSSTIGKPDAQTHQAEAVNYVVRQLLRRADRAKDLLSHGFELASDNGLHEAQHVPGVVYGAKNRHYEALTSPPWSALLSLLGRNGELLIIDLLLDCWVFAPPAPGASSLEQMSGVPLSELPLLRAEEEPPANRAKKDVKSAAAIRFVRHRMFYAKAMLNAKGGVRFGMRHIRESASHMLQG
ncbi:hypothetical protein EJ06DRAFT_21811 [Trichodelitschia bisporula]|uniref:Telomerase reverse transcriptase n=1 Tax=Trichodelitschia bisporula TaxID=703511 RepID=A0A6G1IB85_9PEZI|nr:hypothetical protein EJ06DRAFT_21811 [Trichodelitschia bisporula]